MFDLSNSTGDFTPFVRYHPAEGGFTTKNPAGDVVDVANMTAIFDFENARTGVVKISKGAAPDWRFDTAQGKAVKPSDEYKEGFVIDVYSEKNLFGKREFSGSGMTINRAIHALYQQYVEGVQSNPGKLPVVSCPTDTIEKVRTQHGSITYAPTFKILKWVDRPAEMAGSSSQPASDAGQAAQQQQPQNQQPPADDIDEF